MLASRHSTPRLSHIRPSVAQFTTATRPFISGCSSFSTSLPHTTFRPALEPSQQQQPAFPRTLATMPPATTFYDFKALDKRGKEVPLSDYKGKVVLVVNTASKCGFTPQYAGLEKLWKTIHEKHPDDFVILGFPCNQFGNQEPGSNDDIQQFCQINYGVTFPIMGKVDVKDVDASPLFKWLTAEKPHFWGLVSDIQWNFEKFLIGKDGKVKGRWTSLKSPEALESVILKELAK